MPDLHFTDEYLASLYDKVCADRGDEPYYLHLIHSAPSALDIGCGTGSLLQRARKDGHLGRLVGLDPAPGMLAQARRNLDVEWVQGTLPEAGFTDEFDLVYMTGHAFQVLLTDDDIATVLTAVRTALKPSGRFAFETRNPLARAWLSWAPDDVTEVVDDAGARVRVWHEVESVDDWPDVRVSRSTLRFVPAEHLDRLLTQAGLAIDERYGDWDRSLFTPRSREIITVAHRAG